MPNKRRPNKIDITDVIGTPEDIERRIQEQLNRPKAMFAEEGRVSYLTSSGAYTSNACRK